MYKEPTKYDMYEIAAMQEETFEEFLDALKRLDLDVQQLDERTWEFSYPSIARSVKACVRRQSDRSIWVWINRELVATDEGLVWQQYDAIPEVIDGNDGRMSMPEYLEDMVNGYFVEKSYGI